VRYRSALLGHEVGEEQPALPPGKARVVDHDRVGLDRDPTREEDLQRKPPSPVSCLDFASI